MPYGLKTAPELFQSFLSNLLCNLPRVFVFFDDILIATKSIEEHTSTLSRVMEILLANGVTLNKAKCEFYKSSIEFLGHTLSRKGVTPSLSKVQSIKDMPLPDSKEKLRSFLGLAAYVDISLFHIFHLLLPHYGLCVLSILISNGLLKQKKHLENYNQLLQMSPNLLGSIRRNLWPFILTLLVMDWELYYFKKGNQ